MTTSLQTTSPQPIAPNDVSMAALESALAGDLKRLTIEDRLKYVAKTCEAVGLNPLTKPFDFVEMNGKLVLYANKSCAEQLRKIHHINIDILDRKVEFGVLVVRVKATDGSGRYDEALAAVPFNEKNQLEAANAMMKVETKAKRRVTFSICGLGFVADHDGGEVQHAAPVVSTETSSASLAEKLNASLTLTEKAQAIPVEAAPEPVPVKTVEVEVVKPAPVQQPAATAATVLGGLSPELTSQVDAVLSSFDDGGKKAHQYLISKGKLKPMEDLNRLEINTAKWIADPNNRAQFEKLVKQFQPK